MSLVSIKVANGSTAQQMGTIPVRLGPARLTCDYNDISVLLQLQLPTGTELGNRKKYAGDVLSLFSDPYFSFFFLGGGQNRMLFCPFPL